MKIALLRIPAAAILVGIVCFFPGWLEVSRARERVTTFTHQARERHLEVKVIRYEKSIENPFSWFGGKPTLVVARQARDSNFILLYSSFTTDDQTTNKVLVSPDCAGHKLRIVTQEKYEAYLHESGYTQFGVKLPPWESASYHELWAVMLALDIIEATKRTNFFFAAACNWDEYKTAA